MPSYNTCVVCSSTITEELLQRRLCHPDYPQIPLGPYCRSCLGKVRVCSGCNHPFIIDQGIKYYGKGRYYCETCAESITSCESCGEEAAIFITLGGKKLCKRCYDTKYKKCSCCDTHKELSLFEDDRLTRLIYKDHFDKHNHTCKECFLKIQPSLKKYNVRECKKCKSLYTSDATHCYCDSCYSSFYSCKTCGVKDHTVISIKIITKTGRNLAQCCSSCLSKLRNCSNCHSYDTISINIGTIKKTSICSLCSKLPKLGVCKICLNTSNHLNSKGVCDQCVHSYTENKCSCGTTQDFNRRCRVCSTSEIYNYSRKPPIFFNYTEKDEKVRETLFFGIENEVTAGRNNSEGRDVALKSLYKSFDPSILLAKSDGSIEGAGYEIVTQPMTLDFFKNAGLNKMFHSKLTPSSSCGMHVHVDRQAFVSDLHIYKIVDFLDKNVTNVDKVAGRSYNNYNSKLRDKASSTVIRAKKGSASRHLRVNLQNRTTIEFRLFNQATTDYQLKYRIEFLHALIKWSSASSITKSKDWNTFSKYVKSFPSKYENLNRFFSKRNI